MTTTHRLPAFLPAFVSIFVLLLSDLTHATSVEHWLTQATQQKLDTHPYWRMLLRYEKQQHGQVYSIVEPASFFVSPNGKQSPELELKATLQAMFAAQPTNADDAVACRFPARVFWLRQQLTISPTDLALAACPALDTWLTGINPHQATLVFASDYVNNPSSMFGHTLLRIDAPDQTEDTRLLAYAVNYAAQTNTSNGLEFAYKGLTGGYPGAFSILPYYEKVKEYNDFENRDLWEYQLTLTPDEIRQLLRHLWELKTIPFPYYFLSSNCSYQLLGLFEAARAGTFMRRDFPVYAIPTDTLRRVLAEKGLLKHLVYRPANGTALAYHAQQNSPAINTYAKALANNPDTYIQKLTDAEQARAYEMAYDFLYYQFLAHQTDLTTAPKRLRTLLVKRSQINQPDSRHAPPQPAVDPAHGHNTSRLQLGGGYRQQQPFMAIEWRPAYQDLLDSDTGYRRGAAIDFLRLQLRYLTDDQQLKLQRLVLVGVNSLAPRNDFIKPLSWSLSFGNEQIAINKQGFSTTQQHSVSFIEGSTGINTTFNSENWLCYGMMQGQFQAGKSLDVGWRVGLGPRLGCRQQTAYGQLLMETQSLYHQDDQQLTTTATLGYQWQWGVDNALRLQADYEQQQHQHWHGITLGWQHYY